MSRTDLIADVLAMIKNAYRVRNEHVVAPFSNFLVSILRIFKSEGYIEEFKEIDLGNIRKIKIYLKYMGKKSAIIGVRKVSTSSRRFYVNKAKVPRVRGGFGVTVVSTSKGVMTGKEAQRQGLGGEVVCYIW